MMNRLKITLKRITYFSIFHLLLSGHFSDLLPLWFHSGMLVNQHFFFADKRHAKKVFLLCCIPHPRIQCVLCFLAWICGLSLSRPIVVLGV